ncbi:MAG: enoyl-CoA hydratase/isomerase family protein [Oceanospirillaceae bacterium]|nr:enoyl-CoA hydratase/isomerase family protein [Oceanospirillaceae bacterium]
MHAFTCIKTEREGHILHLTLDRPQVRNAMSLTMVNELKTLFSELQGDLSVRALVIRGEGGHFCAGGDIKDMAGARAVAGKGEDAFFALNKSFGEVIAQLNALPQVVIVVLEGAVLGGGFGLACVSDVAIAGSTAQFAMPETTLGIPPAQIAPFVVKRIGLTQARRLALLGSRINGEEALRLGLVHFYAADENAIARILGETLDQVKKCAPRANAVTKQLMLSAADNRAESLIEVAAQAFSDCVQGPEGQEGTLAFVQKRAPAWAAAEQE